MRKGQHHTQESKDKLSKNHLGIKHEPHSEEWNNKISESLRGKPKSPRAIMNMSLSRRGNKLTEETKRKLSIALSGEKHPWWGRHHSEDSKQKNRQAHLGKKLSPERIEKMRFFGPSNHHWKGGISLQPDYLRIMDHKHRSLMVNADGSFTAEEWDILKKKYNHTCPMCGKKEPQIKLTMDHIKPLSRGGSNYIENIQPLCKRCNSTKHAKSFKINPQFQVEFAL